MCLLGSLQLFYMTVLPVMHSVNLLCCFFLFSLYFEQMVKKCSTVICTLYASQALGIDFVIRCAWVRFVCPILNLVMTV